MGLNDQKTPLKHILSKQMMNFLIQFKKLEIECFREL